MKNEIQVNVITESELVANPDYERTLYELDQEIDMLSSHADKLDYFVAVASGLICGMIDFLWVGDFNLTEGRQIAEDRVDDFVKKTAQIFGCKSDDLKDCVKHLEDLFPIPSDGNTPEFGGGLQHHLRDFAHHPTLVGLIFSLLTQFTGMSYGTDSHGVFMIVPVPEKSKVFIGESIPDKIFKGTVIWFFHLVSDMAGSSSTAALSGGTGIPGPILSLAKEISALPVFKNATIGENSLSSFLAKLFNGTLFAKRDTNGAIIKDTIVKFDFRGELGAAIELGKQAVPVITNDVIVRCFYFIRRLASELKESRIKTFSDLKWINWDACKPFNNPTIDRMLLVATGVFTSVDLTTTVVTQKYWVSVNYVGIGRFTVALGKEMIGFLKVNNVKKIKAMYEKIEQNTYGRTDDRIYGRMAEDMDYEKFGLTLEQTEILYNLEYYKTLNDIDKTVIPIGGANVIELKKGWLSDWKEFMELGFPGFVGDENAKIHWYSRSELMQIVENNNPEDVWFRLVLLEAMVFEPYYTLALEKDKKGNEVPSKKYDLLKNPVFGYKKSEGDKFLDGYFYQTSYYKTGYIKRLRQCYDKASMELNEVLKTALTSLAVAAGVVIAIVATAGMFAPAIAVALVGSNFAGLSGAALTSACLAYIGGGAVAAGGLGMAGGTMAIVGGSAILGLGVGAGAGAGMSAIGLMGKKATIEQSAKLIVSVREIFLNDEHDIEYSESIYEQYVQKIRVIEKDLVDLKLKAETASGDEKKRLQKEIKNNEESIKAMKIAMKSMNRFISSYKMGMQSQDKN